MWPAEGMEHLSSQLWVWVVGGQGGQTAEAEPGAGAVKTHDDRKVRASVGQRGPGLLTMGNAYQTTRVWRHLRSTGQANKPWSIAPAGV